MIPYSGQVSCHFLQVGIIEIAEAETAMGSQEIIEFLFGLHHALETAESLQMGFAHVGDKAAVGLTDIYELLYIARMAGAHLDERELMFACDAQDGEGYPNGIIEVTLCIEELVSGLQDSRSEFFGGGLAIRTGDANHSDAECSAPFARELLQRKEGVVYENSSFAYSRFDFSIIHHHQSGTLIERLLRKPIAIKRLAMKSEEHATCGQVACVGTYGYRITVC